MCFLNSRHTKHWRCCCSCHKHCSSHLSQQSDIFTPLRSSWLSGFFSSGDAPLACNLRDPTDCSSCSFLYLRVFRDGQTRRPPGNSQSFTNGLIPSSTCRFPHSMMVKVSRDLVVAEPVWIVGPYSTYTGVCFWQSNNTCQAQCGAPNQRLWMLNIYIDGFCFLMQIRKYKSAYFVRTRRSDWENLVTLYSCLKLIINLAPCAGGGTTKQLQILNSVQSAVCAKFCQN